MNLVLRERMQAAFAPPAYLLMPSAGIDLSQSGIKGSVVMQTVRGLELSRHLELAFSARVIADGEVTDRPQIIAGLTQIRKALGTPFASFSLPESKSFLFEATAPGKDKETWRTVIEQKLAEYVPLPPADTAFDLVQVGFQGDEALLVGVAYAKRVIDDMMSLFEESGFFVTAVESETYSVARALMRRGDTATVLVLDIGKSTTKFTVVKNRIPYYATTVGIGGHALTLAVQKHFGVSEIEARKVKLSHGIVPGGGDDEYIAATFSTVSAIKDEVARHLDFWQSRAKGADREPISQVILVGGNAPVRGLAEYLEAALKLPVVTGNAFSNFASFEEWLPPMDYMQSLAFATSIGLAIRPYE